MASVDPSLENDPDAPTEIPLLDRYGFMSNSKDANVTNAEELSKGNAVQQSGRERKWMRMTKKWSKWERSAKVKERCRKGIPESVRAVAWQCLCGARTHPERLKSPVLFDILSKQQYSTGDEINKFLEIIDKDLYRTFPHHFLFKEQSGFGQANMRLVLRAYAGYNPRVGYCQGMGFIAGTLVMYMLPEEAFWCLVCLLEDVRIRLYTVYIYVQYYILY